ncbi:MAG: 1-(5-phosphoribosyl)-5-[(5-phosphoribosylamino)methylideneamino] imidazole-4-carboxamide isomerase [Gammaproteobacteria bacterium]|nr:1-(5-phosphoribosyl)-5-[(5-phosphoribosylamino)methylideneamino] imidazole-4-carboxamide isomerase [Gammaproteobacteria bacterium]
MRLIPAIDLRGGRCVRLLRGEFDAETAYDASARSLLERYRDAGADWLHVVDLDGARDGNGANRALIAELAAAGAAAGDLTATGAVRLQVGGGIRDLTALLAMRTAGAARVVIGSAAVDDPQSVCGWIGEFGAEAIALALDVRIDANGTPRLATHGWRRQSTLVLWDAVARFAEHGLRHVLCTDVERDGALAGPNLALYRQALARFPQICWQASGGVRDAGDLEALAAAGVAAAVSGRALLEGRITNRELQPFLPNA